jgi:hypothetical protein
MRIINFEFKRGNITSIPEREWSDKKAFYCEIVQKPF